VVFNIILDIKRFVDNNGIFDVEKEESILQGNGKAMHMYFSEGMKEVYIE